MQALNSALAFYGSNRAKLIETQETIPLCVGNFGATLPTSESENYVFQRVVAFSISRKRFIASSLVLNQNTLSLAVTQKCIPSSSSKECELLVFS